MIEEIKKAIISHPDDQSRYATAGSYAKNILSAALASQLIWITCRPFTIGMAISTAGIVRNNTIDQSSENKVLVKGTLLPLFRGAYAAGAFMGFATAVKLAANASSILRSFGWVIAHIFLIPLPLACNGFLLVFDEGCSSEEWPSPLAIAQTYGG
jgi:hypothetical protein